jgi:uncharacterized membrane protein
MENTKKEGGHVHGDRIKESSTEHVKTALELPENIEAVLCYLFAWVGGIVFFVVEKKNNFIRFHALQSILVFLSLSVLSFVVGVIPLLGWFVDGLLSLLGLAIWIITMIKAYKGERFKLPFVGDWTESILTNKKAL